MGTSEITVMLLMMMMMIIVIIIVMVTAALYLAYPLFQHSTKHFTCVILIKPHSPCGVVVLLASPSYRG